MSFRDTLVALLVAGAFVLLAWLLVARGFSGLGSPAEARPEIVAALESSLADQRTLAADHPERAATHRERFDGLQRLLNRLRILELNRENLASGYRNALLAVIAVLLLLALTAHLLHQRGVRRRLARVQEALTDLSRGSRQVALGDRRRDAIGRVARMIEETSRRVGAERERLEQLEHLSAWQEGARRIAHELRTPLAAAGLGLQAIGDHAPSDGHATRRAAEEVSRELVRVRDFVERFTSFARLPEPEVQVTELGGFLERFVEAHRDAWTGLQLELGSCKVPPVPIDRDLVRQVLSNLCANAAQAAAGGGATVTFSARCEGDVVQLEVADDGPGIEPGDRERIFTPYVTSRRREGGLGLGLPICRKILLDHGGDLELVSSRPGHTTFRLRLPLDPGAPHGLPSYAAPDSPTASGEEPS